MKIVFAGTPAVAVPTLQALVGSEHTVVAVITRADAPVGRKRVLTPSPVAAAAEAAGLNVIKANRLDDAVTQQIGELAPDLGVIVAYGGLVKKPLLETPRLGWINLHFSLLPRWRGAAPVQHSLIAGDPETGVSIFQLVPELDAGAVYLSRAIPIADDATSGEVLASYASESVPLVLDVVDGLAAGTAVAVPQSDGVILAPKLGVDDGRLDWNADADAIFARYRGVTPEPGAHTRVDEKVLKLLTLARSSTTGLPPGTIRLIEKRVLIGTGSGQNLELVRVQPAGRAAMPAADWWRGLNTDAEITAR